MPPFAAFRVYDLRREPRLRKGSKRGEYNRFWRGILMITQEKFQKARMWAYAAGLVVFAVAVLWKIIVH